MADRLTAESKSFLELVKDSSIDYDNTPLEQIRLTMENAAGSMRGDYEYKGQSEDYIVPSEESKTGDIPVTVIKPEGSNYHSVMVYFHGGGWVWSSRQTHKTFCEMIAQECQCVVVNVEYSLAPEHKYPTCHKEAQAVVRWCLDKRLTLTGNAHCMVGVAGDSAGGNISASVCHEVPGIAYQILVYAYVDLDYTAYPSYQLYRSGYVLSAELLQCGLYTSYLHYGSGYLLTIALMKWFTKHYLTNPTLEMKEPLGSPMARSTFESLPPALFIVSECDPLADQSWSYKKKLDAAGVKTDAVNLEGTLHGFVTKPGFFKEANSHTIQKIREFLKSKL